MDVRESGKPGVLTFYCKECEEKYGFPVQIELSTVTPYNQRKYARVDEFQAAHEKCYQKLWDGWGALHGDGSSDVKLHRRQAKSYEEVIEDVKAIFDVDKVATYPWMEG